MTEHSAAQGRSSAKFPAAAERPTSFAQLEIQVGPALPWGTARGRVPDGQAHHLITTFGEVAAVVAGVGGAVLTLHVARGTTGVVLAAAELVLALVAAVFIFIAARTPGRRSS